MQNVVTHVQISNCPAYGLHGHDGSHLFSSVIVPLGSRHHSQPSLQFGLRLVVVVVEVEQSHGVVEVVDPAEVVVLVVDEVVEDVQALYTVKLRSQ